VVGQPDPGDFRIRVPKGDAGSLGRADSACSLVFPGHCCSICASLAQNRSDAGGTDQPRITPPEARFAVQVRSRNCGIIRLPCRSLAAGTGALSLNEACGEVPQEALNFYRILERVARGGQRRLFVHYDAGAAFLKRAKNVFVGEIVADIN
jgi:hypothetical protein